MLSFSQSLIIGIKSMIVYEFKPLQQVSLGINLDEIIVIQKSPLSKDKALRSLTHFIDKSLYRD